MYVSVLLDRRESLAAAEKGLRWMLVEARNAEGTNGLLKM